ncbi:hypothetical protein [Fulvivirga lutea]|uniref:Lipoprotein n=1 Tax=Fulvivirga lutea TaxID=2810512 RepID=A0A975A237_9BACT|nr:hypothetical protein [Fulvivirga lutea]QSE98127.1 hypothetical protein JR347_03325 [Fulvivirga lutea]
MPKPLENMLYTGNQVVTALIIGLLFLSCESKKETKMEKESIMPADTLIEFLSVQKTANDYTLLLQNDSIYRVLAFRKHADSLSFQFMNYQFSGIDNATLQNEVTFIDYLWEKAADSIKIDLKGAMVGYPLEYKDVLVKHIDAVKSDGSHEDQDYDRLRRLMHEANVYQPFANMLTAHGYMINSISTEKHGRVPKEELLKLSYSDSLIIPVPFMVWLEIKKASN